MKKLFIAMILLSVICAGCNTKNIVSSTGNESTNSTQSAFSAFNDERYIWEGWSFSTNKVQTTK